MTSYSNEPSTEAGYLGHPNALSAEANLSECGVSHLGQMEDEGFDEEEEEDVDFNPFLKETMSPEASSSLSSEVEGLDADIVDTGETSVALGANLLTKPSDGVQDDAIGDFNHGEEVVMQSTVSFGGACEKELERMSAARPRKRKSVLISQSENGTFHEKNKGLCSETCAACDVPIGNSENDTHSRKPIIDLDDQDAICMRTRARYSLASFTLDELETFLQETDDDDDLQHVDDEEEYRKFLAAVLQGGDDESQAIHENDNVDDEDEDNDADFELEIEEALESDLDENARDEQEEAARRPETRQNRRQKTSDKKKLLDNSNRRLRTLLPNAPIATFPALDGKSLMPAIDPRHQLSTTHNGFNPHQLGQLHCLIHEHVQLLIQVYSLCVLEPSRQHIASQVQELILELLRRRDQVLSWRRVPYPWSCFLPPYVHPSVMDETCKSSAGQHAVDPSCSSDLREDCSSGTCEVLTSDAISPSKGKNESYPTGQHGAFQNSDGRIWVPIINGPLLSVLDVAPLNFVANYLDDVSSARQEYQRRYVDAAGNTHFDRESLFPLHNRSSLVANTEVSKGSSTPAAFTVPSLPTCDHPPKKTLAATLVEQTKKQSVAPVPKEIAKLAQRFFPLFNPALFPHKPPPAPVANRVLFTETEDELLAMGLMEYNTDWKAIQQRFLPCKSKHQIFVRQKNRSSSKAPENPIKAVRRMKNSALTAEEMARIQEGLKVFKLDWMSVWRFMVPHRDPSLLPRQWRIAIGTQKSYRSNADKKEKRRLYEANRRRSKPATQASRQTSSEREDCHAGNASGENNSGDDGNNEDEAYVHEAFLADWRPVTSSSVSSNMVSNARGKGPPSNFLSQETSNLWKQKISITSAKSQPKVGCEFPAALKHSQNMHALHHFSRAKSSASSLEFNRQIPDVYLKYSKPQIGLLQFQDHRESDARLVKLAPDLPPVNLPPSVRVISQSAFTSYQGGASAKVSTVDAGHSGVATDKLGTSHLTQVRQNTRKPVNHGITNMHPEKSGAGGDIRVAERGESDLQMHPLLFQASEDGNLPYYPLNCSSSSFNFFGGNEAQLNLSLLHNPDQAVHAVSGLQKSSKAKETTSSSCGIDFHPLLQRAHGINRYSESAHPSAQLSGNLESSRSKYPQVQNSSDAVLRDSSGKPSSPRERGNELDLDIHLNFMNREGGKASGSRDVTDHNPIRSNIVSADFGTTTETQNTRRLLLEHGEHFPTATIRDKISSKFGSDVYRTNASGAGDLSLPGIVMEQEELSDSEEEGAEHVEFEREEMEDSEGEDGSDI